MYDQYQQNSLLSVFEEFSYHYFNLGIDKRLFVYIFGYDMIVLLRISSWEKDFSLIFAELISV